MNGRIEVTMFDKISGNVRGVAMAFLTINGKSEKRICHAYITTNGPDIAFDIPRRVPVEQLEEMLMLIRDFHKKVADL